MSYFNSNITGGSGGATGGLVTKFVKTITISSSALAEVTIDISSDITNYKNITNDNIIIELNNASAIAAGDAELSHTYNAETGVITITSNNSNIPFASSSAVELSVNVYVAGAVQLPPVPPVEYLYPKIAFDLSMITYSTNTNSMTLRIGDNVFPYHKVKFNSITSGISLVMQAGGQNITLAAGTEHVVPVTEVVKIIFNGTYEQSKNFTLGNLEFYN